MPKQLDAQDFLNASGVILDVRSPGEYERGHIPGAISFPLFDNEERALVGTCYKQQGRDPAIELGLEITGPKLAGFVKRAKDLAPNRIVRVHCWRGGMRSGSMAWLLETADFSVSTLVGGYKGFRQWVRGVLAGPKPIITLGGMTGSGKTAVLHALIDQGEQVLDLEAIAHHRGSSYGSLGLPPQPSTEHFENLIAFQWQSFDASRPVWVEAESRQIGTCRIPGELFQPMADAPILQIERSRLERIEYLLSEYGNANPDQLIEATERLRRRLGGDRTQHAIECIRQNNLASAINIVLDYYDQTYTHAINRRQVPIYSIEVTGLDASQVATLLREKARFYLENQM
ncbi:MAG: tRNA 2-selenouridine(34) synthase MnmH [Elainellaceae cyanobacterium]